VSFACPPRRSAAKPHLDESTVDSRRAADLVDNEWAGRRADRYCRDDMAFSLLFTSSSLAGGWLHQQHIPRRRAGGVIVGY